jgi:hypothetical protein
MRGGFVECPNRNCALSGSAQYAAPWPGPSPVPNPEAEVTELERLRCLVQTLEQEAVGLRERVRELEKCRGLLDDACNEWERVVGEVASHRDRWRTEGFRLAGEIAAEKSEHLSTRLKLVTALADLQALRESYAECVEAEADDSEQMQRSASDHYGGAKSRLGDVPGFVFVRGPVISCSEED